MRFDRIQQQQQQPGPAPTACATAPAPASPQVFPARRSSRKVRFTVKKLITKVRFGITPEEEGH
jgi:hypothetical protein